MALLVFAVVLDANTFLSSKCLVALMSCRLNSLSPYLPGVNSCLADNVNQVVHVKSSPPPKENVNLVLS